MLKSKKKLPGQILSLFFSLVLIIMSMTVAFAATALTTANVSQWPTLSYNNADGTMYYGQVLGEAISINDDEIVLDSSGNQVAGHFEFIDPTIRTAAGNNVKAHIKFVPDNTEEYTGFEKKRSSLTYNVTATNLKYVDEADRPSVVTEVEQGTKLSEITISGGKVYNPYYPEEPNALAAYWGWVNPDEAVNESGEYEAVLYVTDGSYAAFTTKIQVNLEKQIAVPQIEDKPFLEIYYDPNVKYSNYELVGGKAVDKDTGSEIEGTFSYTDEWVNFVPHPSHTEIDVVFTPNDAETYAPVEFKIPVTVNKGTVKFVDESGNDIVPEITLDRILEVGNDLNGYLKPYLNASCSFNYEETEGYGEKIRPGTHEYTVKTIIDDPNYERYGTLTFKVTVNKQKVTATVKNVVGGKQIYIEGGDIYHLNGTFKVKYSIGDKEAGIIEGVEFNKPFELKQNKSGIYTYDIVYEGTADDYYDVTVVAESEEIRLKHNVKVNGGEATVYTYGDMVTVKAPAHEKPYYVFAGWGDSAFSEDGEVSDTITFSMPDEDIELEATYEFSLKAFFEYIFSLIVDFFAKIAEFLQLQKVCDFFAGIFAV